MNLKTKNLRVQGVLKGNNKDLNAVKENKNRLLTEAQENKWNNEKKKQFGKIEKEFNRKWNIEENTNTNKNRNEKFKHSLKRLGGKPTDVVENRFRIQRKDRGMVHTIK